MNAVKKKYLKSIVMSGLKHSLPYLRELKPQNIGSKHLFDNRNCLYPPLHGTKVSDVADVAIV